MANDPAFSLHETSRGIPDAGGSVAISMAWSNPLSLAQADQVWFDVAIDQGFTTYVASLTQQLVPKEQTTRTLNVGPGVVYARINIHYPGHVVAGIDMGWQPSNVIPIVVAGGAQPPDGAPAQNIALIGNVLSWVPGHGVNGSVVTLQAIDISTQSNFGDILQAGFIPLPANGQVPVSSLPFSVNCPPNANRATLLTLPQGVYIRVNTLFSQITWLPSQVVHVAGPVQSGLNPLWIAAAAGGAILLAAMSGEDN